MESVMPPRPVYVARPVKDPDIAAMREDVMKKLAKTLEHLAKN